MCCRLSIQPLRLNIAESVLTIAQFNQVGTEWQRAVPEEECVVIAQLDIGEGKLRLMMRPAISGPNHHENRRVSAGIYFEVAAKYAEKVDGIVEQHGLVVPCRTPIGPLTKTIAVYPDRRLAWDNVCAGFQKEIINGSS